MFKKLAVAAGAGALLLGMAGSAFAWWPMFGSDNVAIVDNSAVAIADSGGNSQSDTAKATLTMGSSATAGSTGNRTIDTGNASAYAGALVVANTHIGCGLCTPAHDDDVAMVGNEALAGAYTGGNAQDDYARVLLGVGSNADAGSTGNRTIRTGDTGSTARAWTIVNTHWGY